MASSKERLLAGDTLYSLTVQPPSALMRLRSRLTRILDSNSWHWTVIALSSLEFAISFSEIIHDYLEASNPCNCTGTCRESEIFEALEWVSLFITSLFLLEIPMDLVAFGFKFYTPRGSPQWLLHIFDSIIVIGAFVLAFGSKGPLESVVSLLIVLRLWKILKLVLSLEVGKGEFEETGSQESEGSYEKRGVELRREALGKVGTARDESEEETDSEPTTKEEVLQGEVQRLRRRIRELESIQPKPT
ncbi:hypothetical protein JCM16303_001876 [Sporobolomyces ruberrimus]